MRVTLTSPADRPERYLELDHEREVVMLLGAQDELLGSVRWEVLIKLIVTAAADGEGQEKRSSPRAPVALRVSYRTRDQEEVVSVTRDIGGGGTFIETATPLPRGTELTVDFVLPDPPFEHVRAKARVAWAREVAERIIFLPGMGVQFVDIDSQVRAAIQQLVLRLNESRGNADPLQTPE